MNNIASIGSEFTIYDMLAKFRPDKLEVRYLPFNAVLSSNNLPKKINRMLLGLLGFVSHSSRHSLNINSFNVYTLMLSGSFLPLSVVSGTLTPRFIKYFSSILYGCRAPVEERSNVIITTGPEALVAVGVGVVSAAPIATESTLVLRAGGAWVESPAAEGSLLDVDATFFEADVVVAVSVGSAGSEVGFAFSAPVGADVSVARKSEVIGEVAGMGMSLRSWVPAPVCLLESSRSLISKLLLLVGIEGWRVDGGVSCVSPSAASVALFDGVEDAIGRMMLGIRLRGIYGVPGVRATKTCDCPWNCNDCLFPLGSNGVSSNDVVTREMVLLLLRDR
jgi:hypothetical protein